MLQTRLCLADKNNVKIKLTRTKKIIILDGMGTNSKGHKTMIKKVIAAQHVENYFDCPYCGALNSDNGPMSNIPTIDEGDKVRCAECKKTVLIEKIF